MDRLLEQYCYRGERMELGIIGLGKMGGNLALQAKEKGIKVVGKSKSGNEDLARKGIIVVGEYKQFFSQLKRPRVIYLSLPAGKTIDLVLKEMSPFIKKRDVIMDGGNSFYLDSIKREKKLAKKGVYFLDCGTSGGLSGARNGACFMVGGNSGGIKIAAPLLKKLAVKNGYVHTGKPGSGHFTKLVHNGIEFGMLQAIGEGYALCKASEFDLDLPNLFKNWNNGSVIRSWLIELMEEGLRKKDMSAIQSYIEDTGEVNWLVQDAVNKEIPVPVISTAVMELFKSRMEFSDSYKAISLMRSGFGGHPNGKNDYIRKERKLSRLTKV